MILYSYSDGELGPYHYDDSGIRWNPLVLMTSHYFFRRVDEAYDFSSVDESIVRKGCQQIRDADRTGPLILDIECYDFAADFEFAETQLRNAISWVRQEFPDRRLCFYSNEMPKRDYWTPVNYEAQKPPHPEAEQRKQELLEWKRWNDLFRSNRGASGKRQGPIGLIDLCDMTTLGLYTFYPSQQKHRWYMEHNLREARRYDKPIIVWLWTQYHDSNETLNGTYIGDDFLQMQLKLLAEWKVEGVVMLNVNNHDCPPSAIQIIKQFN